MMAPRSLLGWVLLGVWLPACGGSLDDSTASVTPTSSLPSASPTAPASSAPPAPPTSSSPPASSAPPTTPDDGVTLAKVSLPPDDPCVPVLEPLALGVAGAFGQVQSVQVLAPIEQVVRTYAMRVVTAWGEVDYALVLDNDSSSICLFFSLQQDVDQVSQPKKRATQPSAELPFSAPTTVTPADDACAPTVKLIAQALALSATGGAIVSVEGSLDGAKDVRAYTISVDGKDFTVDDKMFPNDSIFSLRLANDEAGRCVVVSAELPSLP